MTDTRERYAGEAVAPSAGTLHEMLRYAWDDIARRWYHSTDGLTKEDFSHDPGAGAMSIGEIFRHQLMLQTLIIENIEPGASGSVEHGDLGEPGAWYLDALFEYREGLNDCFREVWSRVTPERLMEKRPGLPPEKWAEWPAAMRMMRPFVDLATHVGQINYARRQMGKPVART